MATRGKEEELCVVPPLLLAPALVLAVVLMGIFLAPPLEGDPI